MKLNTNSNSYIIIYSAILVVVVAFLLAFIFQALKPMQDANVALDLKKQILYSLNIRGLDGKQAEEKYAEVVKEEGEVNGQKYYACNIDGEDVLVVSLKGMGLWGGISGFVSIARPPALVPRSRTLRHGRRSSSERKSSLTVLRM